MNILNRSVELINPPDYKTLLSNVEQAARNCYRSQDKITDNSAEGMIRALIKSGHEGTIEFANLEFMITCDRAISHQIVRHRIGVSYCQESMRFVNYSKDKFGNNVNFIVPCDITNDTYETWRASCLASESAYFVLLEQGAKPETARSVLPQCTATHLVMQLNMRSLRHFLELRLDTHSQSDIRDIAYKMLMIVYDKYPVFVEDLVEKYKVEFIRHKCNMKYDTPFKFSPKTYILSDNGISNKTLNEICNKCIFEFKKDGELEYDKTACDKDSISTLVRGVINNLVTIGYV